MCILEFLELLHLYPVARELITDGATVAETIDRKHGQLMQRKREKKVLKVECVLREERAKHKDKPCCNAALGKDSRVLTCSSHQL